MPLSEQCYRCSFPGALMNAGSCGGKAPQRPRVSRGQPGHRNMSSVSVDGERRVQDRCWSTPWRPDEKHRIQVIAPGHAGDYVGHLDRVRLSAYGDPRMPPSPHELGEMRQ